MARKNLDYPRDIFGNQVKVGDTIVYAMSLGRGAVMRVYEVLDISKVEGYYYTHEFKVKVKLVASPFMGERNWDEKHGRESTLHGELFHQRAVIWDNGV